MPIPPPPAQQQEPREVQSSIRSPRQALVSILLLLGITETALRMPPPAPGRSFAYRVGFGTGAAVGTVLIVAGIGVVVGGVVYLLASLRRSDTTLVEAIFSWPVVVVVGLISLFLVI